MAPLHPKKVSDSRTEMSQLMLPEHVNFGGVVYGGAVLSIADGVAYVCAARHSGPRCVTASVDRVDFKEPIRIGELVTFQASVNYVGRTSMEIGIKILAEDFKSGKKRHTTSCYFTMVSVDGDGRPQEVPGLVTETEDEKRRWKSGLKRRQARSLYRREAEG